MWLLGKIELFSVSISEHKANDLIDMKKAREVVKWLKLKMIEAKESGDKRTFFGWYVMPEGIVLSI